jgi:hypothetical protein
MTHTLSRWLKVAVCGGLIGIALPAQSEEPVAWAYVEPPSFLQAQVIERANAKELARTYPIHKKIWDTRSAKNLSYTVTPRSGSILQEICENVPIRVRIRNGKLVSATYDKSTARCKKGQAVKGSDSYLGSRMLTPEALFEEIAYAIEHAEDADPPCLRAEFDAATGLPVRLEAGCYMVMDDGYLVTVTEIVIEA